MNESLDRTHHADQKTQRPRDPDRHQPIVADAGAFRQDLRELEHQEREYDGEDPDPPIAVEPVELRAGY